MKIISLFTGKLVTITWRTLRCSIVSLPQFSLGITLRPWTSRREVGERSLILSKRRLNLNIDSPNKIQPRVLRELADVVAKAKFPGKHHLLLKRRTLRTANHSTSPLCPVRSWNRQILLAAYGRWTGDQRQPTRLRKRQIVPNEFRGCLQCSDASVDKGRAIDIYLDFFKTVDMVPKILPVKWDLYGFDGLTVTWMRNSLDGGIQSVQLTGQTPNRNQWWVMSLKGPYWD